MRTRTTLWYVELAGEVASLQRLALTFEGPDRRVCEEEGKFYLQENSFAELNDAGEIYKRAMSIAETFNAGALLHERTWQPVAASAIYRQGADGKRNLFIIMEGSSIGCATTFGVGTVLIEGTPVRREPENTADPIAVTVYLAEKDQHVAEALAYYASRPATPSTLYNVFETIRLDCGKKDYIECDWAPSETQQKRFTSSMCNAAVTGRDARHSFARKWQVPSKPMRLPEAQSFIEQLLKTWINEKTKNLR